MLASFSDSQELSREVGKCAICTVIRSHPAFEVDKSIETGYFSHERWEGPPRSAIRNLFPGFSPLFRFTANAPSSILLSEFRDRLTSLDGSTKWLEPDEILRSLQNLDSIDLWKGQERLLRFKVYTLQEEPSSSIVSRRPLNLDFGGGTALQTASLYLKTCLNRHSSCRSSTPPLLPTRVLDIETLQPSNSIRLHTSQESQRSNYAALSYCWGGSQDTLLSKSTIESYSEQLSLDTCSQTIQDAVLVTRGLGLRYLWIDALCILQDESADKTHEIENMGKIYKDATVTISAANSPSARQGFLTFRGHPSPISTAIICPQREFISEGQPQDLTLGKLWLDRERIHDHSTEPLSLRGWAFQEQVLSSRLLQYGSEGITWHCLDQDKTVQVLPTCVRYKQRSKASRPGILDRLMLTHGKIGYKLWTEMIEDYSGRSLGVPSDRLKAIAGIASELQQLSGDKYLAGLWEEDLLYQLGWRQDTTDKVSQTPISRKTTSPSWSWASTEGKVLFGGDLSADYLDSTALVHSCCVTPKIPKAPFGDVSSGRIVISAKIMRGPHPVKLKESSLQEIREDLGLTNIENAILGTCQPRTRDTLEVTLDQNPTVGARDLSIDSRRILNKGKSNTWYLLLGYSYTKSPIGLILTEDTKCTPGRAFRRIGYFQSKDRTQEPAIFNERFLSIRKQELVII
ncbi:heterokaryon incompatibility protein-domain-containing protein [Tricladium varicosporioides]|nr:heterokaryon incompatibility protein-domain-containing protein [Hymenoscyphus varicosporioides]